MPIRISRRRDDPPWLRAEAIAAAWELFSVLLFISAVFPAAFDSPWPSAIFAAGLFFSVATAPRLLARGPHGITAAAALRIVLWLAAVTPMLPRADGRVLIASFGFGVMAFGIRRAVYRRAVPAGPGAPRASALRSGLRAVLAENAAVAGIVGGHIMLLFSVAFLRTKSVVVFRAWWEIIPALAIIGTAGFTLAVRPLTSRALAALAAGQDGDRAQIAAGLSQAEQVSRRLGALNFGLWFACIAIGVGYFQSRPGPRWADVVVPLAFGALFAWGVSFYQRGWHDDAMRPVIEILRGWLDRSERPAPAAARLQQLAPVRITLRRRMLTEFGVPLLFTLMLSLFASIGMYRTLGPAPTRQEDFNAITALCASFAMLVLAVGGVFLRAARELSEPLARIARVADEVARGKLEAKVPVMAGLQEVEGLGRSIEDMRRALAETIASLEEERAGLERNVERRTAELRQALDELKQAQAALVHGERMALLGQLSANVAHEMVNPLSAVSGSVGALTRVSEELRHMLAAYQKCEGALPPGDREELSRLRGELDIEGALEDLAGVVRVVQSATRRSVEIVSNLKSFARAPAEALPCDLNGALNETLSLLGYRLRQLGIAVEARLGELPLVICCAGEINQVFMNVLTNAIDAIAERAAQEARSAKGASAKGTRLGRILVESEVAPEAVIVSIGDDGPGVPRELQDMVFEPFFTTKPAGRGTGLGLSISRDIVGRHGGALTVEASQLGGARFVLRLPLKPQKRASAR